MAAVVNKRQNQSNRFERACVDVSGGFALRAGGFALRAGAQLLVCISNESRSSINTPVELVDTRQNQSNRFEWACVNASGSFALRACAKLIVCISNELRSSINTPVELIDTRQNQNNGQHSLACVWKCAVI